MDIAKGPSAGDATMVRDGLNVYLEQRAGAMLDGATIDFDGERGFTISGTPKSSCSSGTCSSC